MSVDAVAEKAGVTKKTLYYHFPSKDDLVAATIAGRHQPTLELYARWFAESDGAAADKVRGLFSKSGQSGSCFKLIGSDARRMEIPSPRAKLRQ